MKPCGPYAGVGRHPPIAVGRCRVGRGHRLGLSGQDPFSIRRSQVMAPRLLVEPVLSAPKAETASTILKLYRPIGVSGTSAGNGGSGASGLIGVKGASGGSGVTTNGSVTDKGLYRLPNAL